MAEVLILEFDRFGVQRYEQVGPDWNHAKSGGRCGAFSLSFSGSDRIGLIGETGRDLRGDRYGGSITTG
jgi:hypothetical protein